MDIEEIEFKVSQNQLTAAQVFTQMRQHVESSRSPAGSNANWQPIETAPKDGTRILAFSVPAAKQGYRPLQVTWYRRKKDKAGYVGWGEFNMQSWPPTHWMPIPDAPSI